MNKKILAFVFNGKEFLLLRNNSKDSSHGGDYWFTVTGGVEADESIEDAVKREVKEETNLKVVEIFNLNWGSVYFWDGEDHSENNFLVFVKKEKVVLNEEHVDSEWLNLKDFIRRITWDLNKEELKKKEKIDDFRKKST